MVENSDHDKQRDAAAKAFEHGRLLEALQAIDPVLASGQARVEDWIFTGQILNEVREYAQAAQVFREGLKLESDHAELQYELAKAMFQLGDVTTAVEEFERLAKERGWLQAWTSLATIIPGCPHSPNQRVRDVRLSLAAELKKHEGQNNSKSSIATNVDEALTLPTKVKASRQSRRIRLGYVSAFFHRANYMKPVWGLINGHNRQHFEVELFADDCHSEQFGWFRIGPHDRVHITSHLNNAALGDLVRERSLDIVIDLNAFSVASRLGLYTQRLAASVVAWFNMYATSGLPGMDWIVGDEYVIPQSEEIFYTERVYRLPCSYLAFIVGHQAPDVVPAPCLSSGILTFGSLVSQYKITPGVLDAWSEILRRTNNTRLLLANRAMQSSMNREYLEAELTKRGVLSERLLLLPPAEHFEYLQYYNQIDLALDAFPYNGGTTTTEAIWQGVPVLAFNGDRWASRTSRTLLMNCHLQEFVAPDQRAWIEMAVRWASDENTPQRLQAIRSSMRDKLRESSVCQMSVLVHAMEDFYRSIAGY